MSFVVDTCLLIDILSANKTWAKSAARLLAKHLEEGLVISPLSFIELAPAFRGDIALQREFLDGVGASYNENWAETDTLFATTVFATTAWTRYAGNRKEHRVAKRPIADILIGAFASRFAGLLTRNRKDFAPHFPALLIREPR